MINVGLVGFGFAGRTFHAPVIRAVTGLRLRAILQRSGDDASQLYPESRVVRSIDEMLALGDVDLVVVATPNTTHFELAKRCLEDGRHVVIDKPFTTTTDEARELAEIAKVKGKILSVYQNRRWDGDFQTVQKLLSEGPLGEIVLYESHFDRFRAEVRPDAWREKVEPGSGVLFDLGPHLLDQALVLFGIPEFVQADVKIERREAKIDDAFEVTLFHPRMRAILRATMLAKIAGARFTIHGVNGSFVKHGLDVQEDALKQGKPIDDNWGVESEDCWGIVDVVGSGANRVPTLPGDYRKYYENVRDAIEGHAELAVTPGQALNVMHALELCNRSSREGCRVRWAE